MIDEIAERIWSRPKFHEDYHSLVLASLRTTLGIQSWVDMQPDDATMSKLIQSATFFAGTSDAELRQAAYRIADGIWHLLPKDDHCTRELIHLVLGRLGNFPAIHFLYGDQREERGKELPKPLWLEVVSHEMENTVPVYGSYKVTLTNFQRDLWTTLSNGQSTAVTAPTSAGKSFALQHYLASSLAGGKTRWGLYLVPTRALINQVSASLRRLLLRGPQIAATISTIPVPPAELATNTGIYVLTQERAQLLREHGPIDFDILVVDEAQMIGEGDRGVVLQTVVEDVVASKPDIQILFGSPQTENPDVFQRILGLTAVKPISESDSPVSQNLIWVDTERGKPDQVVVSTQLTGKRTVVGRLTLPVKVYRGDQPLAILSWALGRGSKSIVYASEPSQCEKVAAMIADLQLSNTTTLEESTEEELKEFADFLKTHVHRDYLLADTVKAGVAFHYGAMPTIVRRTIEELFDEGKLDFLVCTSTLLQGVNLPARNLFLYDPTKGREERKKVPITSIDFWNLAGRAGRLGREFEGNVFLINSSDWKNNPVEGSKRQKVSSSLSETVTADRSRLEDFIRNPEHPSARHQLLENTFTRLLYDFRAGRLDQRLERIAENVADEDFTSLLDAVKEADGQVKVPMTILGRNLNVSPYRQQEMLDYIIRRVTESGPEVMMPPHPLDPWDTALNSLRRLFKRIHSNFQKLPKPDRTQNYFAPLALRWMRGDPLPRLIDDAYEYKIKNSASPPVIGTVIRDMMRSLEDDVRFRYVKFTNCYTDLLIEALTVTGHSEWRTRIPQLPLYLELGASSRTMVALIGLGLSRTTAGVLADLAANKDMNSRETREWFSRQNWAALGIPNACLREIRRVMGTGTGDQDQNSG